MAEALTDGEHTAVVVPEVPIRIQIGTGVPVLLGTIPTAEDLPTFLRECADEIERSRHRRRG
jgi:hypothetical protein